MSNETLTLQPEPLIEINTVLEQVRAALEEALGSEPPLRKRSVTSSVRKTAH